MRLVWKLMVIVVVAAGAQCLIELGIGPLDEAQFTVRAYISQLRGLPPEDPAILAACLRLRERTIARDKLVHPDLWVSYVPARGAASAQSRRLEHAFAADDTCSPTGASEQPAAIPTPVVSEIARGDT